MLLRTTPSDDDEIDYEHSSGENENVPTNETEIDVRRESLDSRADVAVNLPYKDDFPILVILKTISRSQDLMTV